MALFTKSRHNLSVLRGLVRLQQTNKFCQKQTIDLHEIKDSVKYGNENIVFSPQRIQNCIVGSSFSEAVIKPVCFLVNNKREFTNPDLISERQACSGEYNTYGIEFSTLYSDGFRMLESYLSCNGHIFCQYCLPNIGGQGVQPYILHPLRRFLDSIDYHSKCMRRLLRVEGTKFDRITETEVALVTAIHLFSNLVDLNDVTTPSFSKIPVPYFVSNDVQNSTVECPCSCGRTVVYGNTSLGTPALFYGRPEVMVFPSGSVCGIAVPKIKDKFYERKSLIDEDELEETISEYENDYPALTDSENISQISAQTLTFAYYQKMFQQKYRNEPSQVPHVSLIPTVAICKNYFDIYMYDVDNDIFLKNMDGPIPLWNEEYSDENTATLNLSSVFILWMTLNHLTLRPKFTNSALELLRSSCGFQQQLSGDHIKEIESTISVGKDFKVPDYDRIIDIAPIKLIREVS